MGSGIEEVLENDPDQIGEDQVEDWREENAEEHESVVPPEDAS